MLADLWPYRELLYFLVWRDVKVRYKQTIVGMLWAIIQPVFTMVVFSIVFGHFAKVPSGDIPYPIFSYCALLPWNLFSRGASLATSSTVSNASIITRVYFPRAMIPIAAVLGTMADFAISFCILIAMMFFYGVPASWSILWLPVYIMVALGAALGVGLWLSSLNVRYRDVGYATGFLMSIWLYATPVIYPSSLAGKRWGFLVDLNPMSGVVEGFRWALLGEGVPPWSRMFAFSVVVSVALLVTGGIVFRRMERTFADVI
jgi:lipopolysaccharide transport system permease protein